MELTSMFEVVRLVKLGVVFYIKYNVLTNLWVEKV